jgi:hypothetical protein
MSERVTLKQVEGMAGRVSAGLRDGLHVVAQGKYGYLGIDLYDSRGLVRELRTGMSRREAYEYLHAMASTLEIVGRDVDVDGGGES